MLYSIIDALSCMFVCFFGWLFVYAAMMAGWCRQERFKADVGNRHMCASGGVLRQAGGRVPSQGDDLSNELLTAWKGYAQTEFTNVEGITDRSGGGWGWVDRSASVQYKVP